jgi:hypothetical protein
VIVLQGEALSSNPSPTKKRKRKKELVVNIPIKNNKGCKALERNKHGILRR